MSKVCAPEEHARGTGSIVKVELSSEKALIMFVDTRSCHEFIKKLIRYN